MNVSREQKLGVFYALAAFGFWGLVPIYFKAVQHVSPVNVLCHRVVWAVPFTAVLITFGREWAPLREALGKSKVLGTLVLTAAIAATNWFIFIYAISTERVLQASLGYFINPLVNVLLGMVFLRERLRRWQAVAVLLAAAGTLNLTLKFGALPWISLGLAFSFGFYGLLRKTVRIESLNGLFVETSLLFLPAFGYLAFAARQGTGAFGVIHWKTTVLLALAGAVTSLPLVWFTSAARKLRYSTIGLLQYLAPSLQFMLAVFLYEEPFTLAYLVTFGCIWSGLTIFVVDSLSFQRLYAKKGSS
ncbi:MAG: EamA family transporter RarD [Desulfobacteraceae bacterium]